MRNVFNSVHLTNCDTMKYLLYKVILLWSFLIAFTFATQAQSPFVVTTSRMDKTYKVNEWMTFDVVSDITDSVNYEIRFDRYAPPIQQGKIGLQAGQTTKIYFKAEEPCALICMVSNPQFSDVEGAVFEPFSITPLEEEPSDFDAFWLEALAELARVPIDPKLSFYEATDYSTTYRLNLGMIDGRRVYGFLSVPKLEGKMPAVVSLPSFGAGTSIVRPVNDIAENIGALALAISIHNAEPDAIDSRAYEPDNLTNPKEYYQRYAVLAAIRAIDYFFTRPDFNGSVGLTGVSQGGGLVVMVAGVDKRVAAVTFGNPTHSEHSGLRHERATGFPYYFVRAKTAFREDAILQKVAAASKYYDNIYFAKRYKKPSLAVLGYEDQVCPTATSFAAFNQLEGKKILLSATKLAHNNPGEYWALRYDFFRRFLVGADRSPLPYVQAHKGYEIDAGRDTTIHINQPLMLHGVAMLRHAPLTKNIRWRKLHGNGEVTFANPNEVETNVTFSNSGEYTLALEVRDETLLHTDKFYTLLDQVKIIVKEASQSMALNCPSDIRVVTREFVAQVNWQTPTVSNACNNEGVNLRLTNGLLPNSYFPRGITRIAYQATDACGQVATCSFQVEVISSNALQIECPKPISVITWESTTKVAWELPKVRNACHGQEAQLTQTQGLPSGSDFSVGLHTITYQAVDTCGQLTTCSFEIEVVKLAPMELTCPKDIKINTSQSNAIVEWENPNVVHSCYNNNIQLIQTKGLAPGSAFPIRITEVEYKVKNDCGQEVTCSFIVEVVHILPALEVECPNHIVVTTLSQTAIINWELPKVKNACSASFQLVQNEGQQPNSLFPVGTTTISYLVEDACGRSATCSFTVQVIQQELNFEVECPENIDLMLPSGQWIMRVYWNDPLVTTACHYGLSVKRIKGIASGSYFTIGVSEIIYEIKDECGNSAICAFTITITPSTNTIRNSNNNPNETLHFDVYPNPASQQINVSIEDEWAEQNVLFEIVDVLGRWKGQYRITKTTTPIDISHFTNGWYFWRISSPKNEILQTGRFVKRDDRQ